ncbi:Alpha/Beta hydrolase protein [Chytriomyces sp. MP71]|nr:Alpha/Beta hydrolase protein [Chytriomyces sp. MP71]
MNANLASAVALTITGAAIASVYAAVVPDSRKDLGSFTTSREASAEACAVIDAVYPLRSESQFAALSAGKTHYYILGKDGAKRVVLVHGITGTWQCAPDFVDGLVSAGFMVLVYDLYGRGHSSSPPLKYSGRDYAIQLSELLDHVGWRTATVLGYSLGGGIAVEFADAYLERVDDLVLVAPAGLLQDIPLVAKIVLLPILGPIIGYSFGRRILKSRNASDLNPRYRNAPQTIRSLAMLNANIDHHPGLLRAFLETVRSGPIRGSEASYARVAPRLKDRLLCVW